MSQVTITATIRVDDVLTDPTFVVLSNDAYTYGVKRNDTGAVVVANNTAMTKSSTGVYTYTFTDPAPNLSYTYVVYYEISGTKYRETGTCTGGSASPTDLDSLDAQIIPFVNGAPSHLIHQKQMELFREFCKQTEVWTHKQTTLTVADQAEYDFDIPDETSVYRLKSLEVEDLETYVYELDPEDTSFTLHTAPSKTGDSIEVEWVVIPDVDRDYAPGWFMKRYGDALANGVIAHLKAMARTPWHDPQGAQFYLRKWHSGIAEARGEALDKRAPRAQIHIPKMY